MSEYYNKDLDTLFQLAVKFHQQGKLSQAEQSYRSIIESLPGAPIVLYNLGLVLFQSGNLKESEHYYREALKLVPEDVDILYNLALCIKTQGRLFEACNMYQAILCQHPDDIDTRYNLGCCYKDMHEEESAIEALSEVVRKNPEHLSAINNLAYLYHKQGDLQKALEYYSLLLTHHPDHIGANHMVDALKGNTPLTAPFDYVTEVFDEFAESYDKKLTEELQYAVPETMFSYFSDYIQSTDNDCLDIGCGTGLGGLAFSSICRCLVGVDLSSEMVAKATAKAIYDRLYTGDILSYLEDSSDVFSLIIATDVFTYLGELKNVFSKLASHAAPGCYFCFSVENTSQLPFQLRESGRFAHSRKYIEETAGATGWKIIDGKKANLRKERDAWITGYLFLLQRQCDNC